MAIQEFRLNKKSRRRYRVFQKKVPTKNVQMKRTKQVIDITISSQGRYREDDIGVSVDKTQYITLSLESEFHQTVLALFNQCNELKS